LGAACSATANKTGFTATGGSGNGGAGSGAGTGTGAGLGTGGGITIGAGGSSPTCDTHCSADLHSVLDCNNVVVTTCSPTEGCGATGCVAACDAAQQNKSTIGCDYYSVDPDVIMEVQGACFAAYIANTWNGPVTIQVTYNGQMLPSNIAYVPQGSGQSVTYNQLTNGQLMPGEVAVVFLAGNPNASVAPCPAGKNVGYPMDGSTSGTGIGNAFHITTSAPVVAYDIFPFGGGQAAATSATLLLPTTAWDTNYIAIDAYTQSQIAASAGAQPSMDFVASMDGTTVTILPTVDIVGGNGVAAASANTPQTYNLNAGQVLQISQPQELIGSIVQSNNPIGHWAGASCLNIPVDTAACDAAHQQIPPVKALGHEYVGVRYPNRFVGQEESPPWRMVGAVNGTILTWDPAAPAGAPLTLKQGQLVEFNSNGPWTVSSQDAMHPFYMAAFMTGCAFTDPEEDDCRGDPEFVNVIPPQQYLSSYTFFTDPTYPETNLVLTRTKGTNGFSDVKLDCAGTITGWTPVGSAGDFEYTTINLVTGNFQGSNGCDNGVHQISSNGLFGLGVWGWGSAATAGEYGCSGCGGFYSQAVSYSYPAGASVQPINQVVIPPMPQ
jgi:hypothetical protein